MINLFCFMPQITDATSFYRGWGPISLLRKQWQALNPIVSTGVNWTAAFEADVAFVQRPALLDQLNVIQLLKEHGTPVWVDYDDDYINTSESNPRHGTILEQKMTDVIKRCLSAADVVTVTNEAIKNVYSEFNDNIHIIPNAMDDRLYGLQRKEIQPVNAILWRGNDKQDRDVYAFRKEILSVYRNFETGNYNWMFSGFDPCFITDEMRVSDEKRIQVRPGIELFEYHRQLCETNWAVIIKPLQDTLFNRSRSNIGWIEACLAGSAYLAPNFPSWTEYSDASSLYVYEGPEDFKKQLTHILKHPEEIGPRVAKGREYIKENLKLSTINLKRRKIITELIGKYTTELNNGERTSSPGSDPGPSSGDQALN